MLKIRIVLCFKLNFPVYFSWLMMNSSTSSCSSSCFVSVFMLVQLFETDSKITPFSRVTPAGSLLD